MLLRLMSFFLFLLAAITQPLHAQDDVFAGWTPRKSDTGLTFQHNASEAFVSVIEMKDTGRDKTALLFNSARKTMPAQCGDMTKTTTRSVDGGRRETSNVDQEWNCMVVVAPSSNAMIIILAIDMRTAGADSKAVAYAIIAKATGNGSQNATQASSAQISSTWPKGGLVAETRADIDWPTAWKMGLNPNKDLLPTRYECFDLGARTPNSAADSILNINANGRYSYTSKTASGQGTWQRSVNDNLIEYRFSGVLGHRKKDYGLSIIQSDEYGQRIILAETTGDGQFIACYQSGPAAEYARLQMASGLVDGQIWQCKFKDGAVLPVQFSNGRYQSQRGGGVYRSFSLNEDGDQWSGAVEFDGGPFANAQGKMKISEYGQRSLALGVTVNTRRGYWYNADETTPVAQCFSDIPGRQYPEYGIANAPATGMTGGPSGEYTVTKYDAFSGGLAPQVYSFAANGWYLDETPEDRPFDCNRTKPSGEPYCLRYELAPGKIRLQSKAGKWDDDEWESYKRSAATIVIEDSTYNKLTPLTGLKLAGTYKTQSSYSSGDIFTTLATIQFQGEFVFTADGRFSTESGVFSRVGIGPGINNDSAIVGSSYASNTDGSSGRYRIEGNWLILTRDDGIEARKYIHTGAVPVTPNEKVEYIYIGDNLYALK
jgi:hypothetical protein